MANVTDVKVIFDGYRNATVRIVGTLDTANLSVVSLVTLTMFTNNDPGYKALRGFRIDEVKFTSSNGLTVSLEWNATTPQFIANMADANEQCWEEQGGLIPDMAAAGFDGSLNVKTYNWVATVQAFTLTVEMVKLYTK
jgi:hypothetical protein